MNLSDLSKHSPEALKLVSAIEERTAVVARLYISLQSAGMDPSRQTDIILALAEAGVALAHATAALFNLSRKAADRNIETIATERPEAN